MIETHGTAEQAAAAKPQTVQRQTPKVGRNDPCPCGSGKKYKKCHGMDVVPNSTWIRVRTAGFAGRLRRGRGSYYSSAPADSGGDAGATTPAPRPTRRGRGSHYSSAPVDPGGTRSYYSSASTILSSTRLAAARSAGEVSASVSRTAARPSRPAADRDAFAGLGEREHGPPSVARIHRARDQTRAHQPIEHRQRARVSAQMLGQVASR